MRGSKVCVERREKGVVEVGKGDWSEEGIRAGVRGRKRRGQGGAGSGMARGWE